MAREAPISRDLVDEARPWLRLVLGIAFVAYSAASTIFIGADDLMWLFPSTQVAAAGFPVAYWYSGIVAAILFIGEVATGEKHPGPYRIFLAPDVFYTARGVFGGVSLALGALIFAAIGTEYREAAGWIGWLLAFPVAGVIGFIIARWGEILIFGKRRSRRSKKEE
jgi:hypothetical protein